MTRPARTRLHLRGEFRIQRGDGYVRMHAAERRELLQHIDVARDEKIFRDERNRIAKFRQHLEA